MEYLIVFLEGIASFISPCLLPLLPMYISYFAGQEVGRKKTIIHAISFIIGFTITFVLLGVFAGTFGHFVKQYATYINIVMGIIVILFGLNFLGIIHIFDTTKGIQKKKEKLNVFSAIIFGMIFALCWTPCVGAFLGTALMLAATYGSVIKGAMMLLLFSLGLGIPFLFSAIFLEKLQTTFNWIKKHYDMINKICGVILIIIGTLIMVGFNFQSFSIGTQNETNDENVINNEMVNNETINEEVNDNENTQNITDETNQMISEQNNAQVMANEQSNEAEQQEVSEYKPIKINGVEEFKAEVLQSTVPVLVDFYADWCGPCKQMEPIIEEIAKEMQDSAKIVKVDVDKNEELSYQYNVFSIPTMYIFKNGEVSKMFIGIQTKNTLLQELQ